jgi:hypothetical protein
MLNVARPKLISLCSTSYVGDSPIAQWGFRIMVITPVLQAGNQGSIPCCSTFGG